MESFFARLKVESFYAECFENIQDAYSCVFEYIKTFYNSIRRHSANDYKSSNNYEQEYYNETHYNDIDFSNFQCRLKYLTETEQLLYVDDDIMKKFYTSRKIVCELLNLNEQIYINKDKHMKECNDESCRSCNPICFCQSCHRKCTTSRRNDSY